MTRVLHTGDTHIGYRQYHSPERRADFLAAFRRVVEDAIADDVDAVVHAGDLFHDRRPALADIHGTIEVLRDLREAGVPLYAVWGTTSGPAASSGSTCSRPWGSQSGSAGNPTSSATWRCTALTSSRGPDATI